MNKHLYFIAATLLWLLSCAELSAQDATAREVLQPQFGKQVVTVATGEEIIFYDPKGTGAIASASANNTQSLTVFQPAEAGMSVQVTFETLDVKNDGANYPGKVYIYNGNPDSDNSFTWATGVYGSFNTMPEGDIIETLDGDYSNVSYYSTSPDGILSVGMLWRYAKRCEGWVAKVKVIKLTDMTVTGGGSDYTGVMPSPKSKTGVALASFYVDTEGIMNPDRLTSVSLALNKNEAFIDPSALKLYAGGSVVKGATPLSATVSTDGDVCTMTLDHTLVQGRNTFVIATDFPLDAPVGAQVEVGVSGITTAAHPSGVQPFAAATPVTVANPAIVLMAEGHSTVTVGDIPLALYDDGGADGQTAKGFKGIMTFVPSVPGKKVQIDLSSVKLYIGSVYYQYINIYDGREASADKLVRHIAESGVTALVHSTAEDGSLTIELSHNGLTGFTSDGIEATVSLFEPQPMTVENVSAAVADEGTVCAGDTGQNVIKINVKTRNTEPALTADGFRFSTNGTSAIVGKATLFYAKADETLSVKTKVGEAQVVADEFTINPDVALPLCEGDNWFVLAYDIDNTAMNGQTVAASVSAVILGGQNASVENGNPGAVRTVENTVYSHAGQGTVVKTVNGSISFKTRNRTATSASYESGTDDRTTTFVPLHDDMVCQIDFSKFKLYYGSSSYQPKAKFRIYSGQGTAGELLWELSSADRKDEGPGRVIRSTSADGALTVVFNPNESSTYYTSEGFEATVSEYKSRPMEYKSADVTQTSTSVVPPGSENQPLLTVNVITVGDMSQQTLNGMKAGMKGLQANVSRLNLYAVGSKDAEPAEDALPVATAAVTADDAEVTLTAATPVMLSEGNNFFRITADVSGDAASDGNVDAALLSVNIGGTEHTVENGDPEGALTVKDIYLLKPGENGEVTVRQGRNVRFYDDGGADGSASKNFDGTVTFVPGTEGDVIKLTYELFKLSYSDHLYVYDGGVADETKLVKDYSGSNIKDKEYVSGAEDGKITVRFVVKSSYTLPDFAMEVKSYRKKPKEIVNSEAAAVAPANVMRGQGDVPMVRLAVTIEGDYDDVDISRFDVSKETSSLKDVKVYATGTADTFAPNNLYGILAEGATAVEGSYNMVDNGTYYFWIAADIDASAGVGDKPSVSFNAFTANGAATEQTPPVVAATEIKAGASGVFTVGDGADFGTIQAAVDNISGGVDGPVVINVKRGIYNEKVNVPDIPGTSAANTITIQSETGNYNDVKVYYDKYTEPVYSDDKMFHEYGVFTIAGADYVTLRGMELTTADITFPSVVHVKNASRNVTVENCYVHAEMTTSYSNDINLIYTYAKNEANCNNDRLAVRGCLLEGGYIGVRLGGTSFVALPKQVGGTVENCVFRNQGSKGIYSYDEQGARITGNTFVNNASDASTCYGVDITVRDENTSGTLIAGNRFNFAAQKAAIPLYMRNMAGTASAPVLVMNNEIIVNSSSASSAGIEVSSASAHLAIVHNTVRLTGTGGRAMWFNDNMGEGVNVMNNIFMNETQGPVYRFYKSGNVATVKCSANVLHTAGDAFAYAGADVATFEDWLALSGETGSYNESVAFLSDNILEPAAAGVLLNAVALDYVTTDIDGTARAAQPTIGAYEYNGAAGVPVIAANYPAVRNITDTSADVVVKADAGGKAFVMVVKAAEPAPSADDIKASAITADMHKNAENSVTANGLETDCEYVAYVVVRSLRGIDSGVAASSAFIATGNPVVEIPSPTVTVGDATVESGNAVTLVAAVGGGTAPYSVVWTNGKHEQIGAETLAADGNVPVVYTPAECDDYTVSVADANGKTASATCRVIVTGDAVTATFENLYLDEESYWNGSSAVPEGEDMYDGSFVSGSYRFDNGCMPDYNFWYNFGYSNSTSPSFGSLEDQFNSAAGGGYGGSENFAVAYPQGGAVTVMNNPGGDVIRGFYITNSAYAANSMNNGDSYGGKFGKGDWFKLTVTGMNAGETTGSIDYYLADFRSDNELDHYVLDTWQWVDLRALGKVTSLGFTLDGSDKSDGYLNTPAYFCMDNFNGERVVAEAPRQTVSGAIDLAPLFDFDDALATVVYALPDGMPADAGVTAEITDDGKLRVTGNADNDFTVLVSAVQRGKIQFVNIPLHYVATGITDVTSGGAGVEARYTVDGKRLSANRRGVNIVRMKDGTVRKVVVK